jgi:hypothetical protein
MMSIPYIKTVVLAYRSPLTMRLIFSLHMALIKIDERVHRGRNYRDRGRCGWCARCPGGRFRWWWRGCFHLEHQHGSYSLHISSLLKRHESTMTTFPASSYAVAVIPRSAKT